MNCRLIWRCPRGIGPGVGVPGEREAVKETMLRPIMKLRTRLAQSPVGALVRWARLARPLNRSLEHALRGRGVLRPKVCGRPVAFRCVSRREFALIDTAYGEFSHIEDICSYLNPGDVFFDIGANVGLFGVSAAALNPGAVVHMFEPEPATASRLRENVELNELRNVHIHEVAASDRDGVVEFFIRGEVGVGTHSANDYHHVEADDVRTTRVREVSLLDYIESEGMPLPTVVKCDVEGAEGRVLRGLQSLIERQAIRRFDVELHLRVLAELGEDPDLMQALFRDSGYVERSKTVRGHTVNISYTLVGQ